MTVIRTVKKIEDNRDRKGKGTMIDLNEIREENLVWQKGNDPHEDLEDHNGKNCGWEKYSSISVQSERFLQVDPNIPGESGTAWDFDEEATQFVNKEVTEVANEEEQKLQTKIAQNVLTKMPQKF